MELTISLDDEFKTIQENFSKKIGRDYAASRGEYLNGIIMAAYLGYEFIDAAEVIFFDEEGEFDAEKTNEVLSERLAAYRAGGHSWDSTDLIRTEQVHTFSRGGSDITGSIVAKSSTCRYV